MLAWVLVWSGVIGGVVGALPPRRQEPEPTQIRFVSMTPTLVRECPGEANVCFRIPFGSDMHVGTLAGTKFGTVPLYRRMSRDGGPVDPERPWEIEIVANLKPRNLQGTVNLLVYERDDAQALAAHEVIAMWSATMPPFLRIAAELRLDPERSEFRRGRVYLFRVAQLLGKREVILAQGSFVLD